MSENIANTSIVWKQIANMWNVYFTPPSRISREEAEKYNGWLKQKKDNCNAETALVLGATPEIRDILTKFNFKTTIVDINQEMIEAMNSLLKTKNPDEVIVVSNWIETHLKSGQFDVVIGDAVLPNIPWDKRDLLLSEIHRLLKSNGVFITRAFCIPKENKIKNLENLLNKFSDKKPTYKSALELELELQILSYDTKTHLATFLKPKEMIAGIRNNERFNTGFENLNEILDIVWNFWSTKFIDKVFVYNYRDKEELEYQKYFEIVDVFESEDNEYSKITPMYVLRKK
ncbi:MAG: class I SAM-dependent methyltransferase [Candidatus Aenigmarchaeota archaeon]|nr:class I SAM-dependent methyltransferase [Candidatus Aenigmarchaeota archaeon]